MSRARRAAGEGNVRRRNDGRWEARVRYIDPVDGLAKREHFYGRTQRDVTLALQEAQRRIARSEPVRDEGTPLGEFLEWWLENVVEPSRRPNTHRSYKTTIEQQILTTQLARIPLRDLRPAMIQTVLVNLGHAPTRSDALAIVVLRTALAYAVKAQMLHSNPAAEVQTPRVERGELRPLTTAEARRFLAKAKDDRLFALYALALHSGMRLGELLALEWRDVDLHAGTVRVERHLKTRAARRTIALGPETIAALRAHRDRMQHEGHALRRVFVSERGHALNPSNLQKRSFKPLLRAAKCPEVRFHDLRHTAATLLLSAGVHPKIVSERLGHANVATTMNVYQHVDPAMQRSAASALEKALRPSSGRETGGQRGGQGRRRRAREK